MTFSKHTNFLPDFSKQNPDIFITYLGENCADFAFDVAQKLREIPNHNLQVVFHPLPLKPNKAFTLAENRGANLIAILGESEVAAKKVSLKSLITKAKIDLELNDLASVVNLLKA
ncbi:MAG: His/Gly/Thr/Pro-type tRNA ligase C-terminal domain-containing protein [Bacteriovoracaceae bacterium]